MLRDKKKSKRLKTDWIKMVSSFDSCHWLRFCFCFLNFIIGIFYPLRLLTEQRNAESGAFFFPFTQIALCSYVSLLFFVAVKCQQAILCGFTRGTNIRSSLWKKNLHFLQLDLLWRLKNRIYLKIPKSSSSNIGSWTWWLRSTSKDKIHTFC